MLCRGRKKVTSRSIYLNASHILTVFVFNCNVSEFMTWVRQGIWVVEWTIMRFQTLPLTTSTQNPHRRSTSKPIHWHHPTRRILRSSPIPLCGGRMHFSHRANINPKWLKVHFIVIFLGVNILPITFPTPSPYAQRYSDIQTPTLCETSSYQSDQLFHSQEYWYSTSFYGKE
jgi:hypothetical protein